MRSEPLHVDTGLQRKHFTSKLTPMHFSALPGVISQGMDIRLKTSLIMKRSARHVSCAQHAFATDALRKIGRLQLTIFLILTRASHPEFHKVVVQLKQRKALRILHPDLLLKKLPQQKSVWRVHQETLRMKRFTCKGILQHLSHCITDKRSLW